MPLTKSGEKVRSSMHEQYGSKEKGDRVFYASINAGKPGSSKWHGKKRSKGKSAPIQKSLRAGGHR